MKKTIATIFALGTMALAAQGAKAADHAAHHPDGENASVAQKTDAGMDALQDSMKAIRAEKSPIERRKLMMGHMQAMRGYMHPKVGMQADGGMPIQKHEAMMKFKKLAGKVAAEKSTKKQEKLVKENAALIADHLAHMGKMMGMMQGGDGGVMERMGKMEMMMGQMLEHMEQMQDSSK